MQLELNRTALVQIDIQERLCPAIPGLEPFMPKIKIMLQGAAALELPTLITEQYPRGLGNTLTELKELFRPEWPVLEKTDFSCWGCPAFRSALEATEAQTVILTGIEAHVCVQQTAFDLLDAGYQVVLAADTVASRNAFDRDNAVALMRASGIKVTTVEAILFGLMRSSRHPSFKNVSALVR